MFPINLIKKWLEKREEQRIETECQRLFERNAGLLITREIGGLHSDKNAVQALTTQLAFYARHPYHEEARRRYKEIADSVHKISNTGGALSIWSSFYTNALNAKPRTLLENTHVAKTFNDSFQHFFVDHIKKHPHTLCSFLAKGHHEPLIQDKNTKTIICRSLRSLCSEQKNAFGSHRARFAVLDFLCTHSSAGPNDSTLRRLCTMLKGQDGQRKPEGLEKPQMDRLNEIYCDFFEGVGKVVVPEGMAQAPEGVLTAPLPKGLVERWKTGAGIIKVNRGNQNPPSFGAAPPTPSNE